jgi:hypothetical protein
LQSLDALFSPPYTLAMLFLLPSDAISKSPQHHCCLSHAEKFTYKASTPSNPTFLGRKMPIPDQVHYAVYHDHPILVYFLDHRRRRGNVGNEGDRMIEDAVVSSRPNALGRLACSVVCVLAPKHEASTIQWQDPIQDQRGVSYDPATTKSAQIHVIKTNAKCAQTKRETYDEAATASSPEALLGRNKAASS